jgi:hypothetical protein
MRWWCWTRVLLSKRLRLLESLALMKCHYHISRLCVSPDLRDQAGDKKERIKVVPIASFRVYFAIILRFAFLARIMSMVDDSVEQLLQREPQWQVISLPTVAILHYGYQPEAIAALKPWFCSKLVKYRRVCQLSEKRSLSTKLTIT